MKVPAFLYRKRKENVTTSNAQPDEINNSANSPDLDEVLTRGVVEVLPDRESLAKLMRERKIRVYLGIDPTGSLLTLGHSVVLRKLQQLADLGHEVILLIGNGTVRIGDPTGKDETRPVLTDETIRENFKNWKEQANKILDFSKIEIRYNGDWLDKLTYQDIVKLMAKTTIQQLLERDMFQERMAAGRPIHAHELIYPLLQGYDSVVMDVDLEIGGTDQTFNMMMGRQLQKIYNNREKWVLTTPLVAGSDGRKMSKSLGNYIALTEEPNDMYGRLMSITDSQIIEYFVLMTDVPLQEIKQMEEEIAAGTNPMAFKKQLAYTITAMYHTQKAAQAAQEHFETTVQGSGLPAEMPEVTVSAKSLSVLQLLTELLPHESKSQLKRLIEQGGVELLPAGQKPTDPFTMVEISDGMVVRAGKRQYFKVVL